MTRALIAAACTLVAVPAAIAASTGYDRFSFSEPTSAGLEVQPPLDEFRAVAGATAIAPDNWTRLAVKQGKPQYLTRGTNCRFRVTWSVRSRIADDGDAVKRLDEAINAPAKAHVYEEGSRNGRPFRVVKIAGAPSTYIRGVWVGVLTRRKDVAPAGKVVWAEITANARERRDDECHSGSVHAAARGIADGLAIASVRLKFVRP